TDVTVRARAQAPPVGTGPVAEVVPANRTRSGRPVGHLVPGETGRRQGRVRGQVAVGGHVVVRGRQLAAAYPRRQRRALLQDQGVRADVVNARRQRGGEGGGEVLRPLPRRAVDQIQ